MMSWRGANPTRICTTLTLKIEKFILVKENIMQLLVITQLYSGLISSLYQLTSVTCRVLATPKRFDRSARIPLQNNKVDGGCGSLGTSDARLVFIDKSHLKVNPSLS